MKLAYWGPLASGTVGNGPAFDFVRGEAVEVPDEFGKKLLADNPDWRDVSDDEHAGEKTEG